MSKPSARMAMDSTNGTQKKLKGEKRHNEQKRLDGKRWRLWWRGWMRQKKKTTNKNRRKETKENQKRKKMEVQAKATTNDRNKKKSDEET